MRSLFKRPKAGADVAAVAAFTLMLMPSLSATASEMTERPPSWTGFYVGVGGGAAILDYDLDIDFKGLKEETDKICFKKKKPYPHYECPRKLQRTKKTLFRGSEDIEGDNTWGFATIQLEYKKQIQDKYVVSIFADAEKYYGGEDSFSKTYDYHHGRKYFGLDGNIDLDYSGTVGITAGLLVRPDTLLYGLIGYTYLKLDSDITFSQGEYKYTHGGYVPVEKNSVNFDGPDELHGLTLGAGIQKKLSEAMSIKLEYRYTDLEDEGTKGRFYDHTSKSYKLGKIKYVNEHKLKGKYKTDFDSDLHTIRAAIVFKLHRQEQHVPLK